MPDYIPSTITLDHLVQAIHWLDEGKPHNFAPSTTYDVVYEGRRYPPKAVVGIAGELATGRAMSPSDFSGGIGSKCFRVLKAHGFSMVKKIPSYVYNVGETWLSHVSQVNFGALLNYWRPNLNLKVHIEKGATVYFRLTGKALIVGRAVFDGQKVMTLQYAWDAYGEGNGAMSVSDMERQVVEEWKQPLNEEINCSIFKSIELLSPNDYYQITGAEYGVQASKYKRYTDDAIIARVRSEFNLRLKPSFIFREPDESEELESYSKEGEKKFRYTSYYERKPEYREKALRIHGYACKACGFDFEAVYGEIGKGFIHVHHVEPVSEFDEAKVIDPETAMIPVCPNCHSMIHRRKNHTLTIDEVKALLRD
ncbi:MAG: HNH endonuclease [Emcibacteraceae bacterium]|nr:HNH endonuclease [Emcibacteraceae bacterium]